MRCVSEQLHKKSKTCPGVPSHKISYFSEGEVLVERPEQRGHAENTDQSREWQRLRVDNKSIMIVIMMDHQGKHGCWCTKKRKQDRAWGVLSLVHEITCEV